MLEAIERIQRHQNPGREVFDTDELVQVWMVRHLQIIGEAVSHLSEDLRARYPDIPWRSIIGMRHILVHGYFEVDLDLVWQVVENELDKLKATITSALTDPATRSDQSR
ncbi:MAG: HepT-like ribonuclease domain-containing protein [Pseudonocardiaceae bacterium]